MRRRRYSKRKLWRCRSLNTSKVDEEVWRGRSLINEKNSVRWELGELRTLTSSSSEMRICTIGLVPEPTINKTYHGLRHHEQSSDWDRVFHNWIGLASKTLMSAIRRVLVLHPLSHQVSLSFRKYVSISPPKEWIQIPLFKILGPSMSLLGSHVQIYKGNVKLISPSNSPIAMKTRFGRESWKKNGICPFTFEVKVLPCIDYTWPT